MRRFGLIGRTLKHSFSKNFFAEKFRQLGLSDCSYDLYPLDEISAFPTLIKQHDDWVGFNVTIPYKTEVLQFATNHSNLPAGLYASNCLHFINGEIIAYNTDVLGFEQSFLSLRDAAIHQKALVLGSGGAAQAVAYVLQKNNIPFITVGRVSKPGTEMTYQEIDLSVMASHQIIINTTPLGTYPAVNDCPDLPYKFLTPQHYLFDLVYNPAETAFFKKGKAASCSTKNGWEMLQIQAEESWLIWNAI